MPKSNPVTLWIVFVMFAASAMLAAFVSTAAASSNPDADDFIPRIIDRTNMYRQQNGCAALTPNAQLQTAAQGHTDDMAANDYFSHTGSDGSDLAKRLQNAGYSYSSAGENIAAGYPSPEVVVDAWFNETPPDDWHRRNILNCKFQEIGVGYTYLANDAGNIRYHSYWTEDFGQPRNSTRPTQPPTIPRSPTPTRTRIVPPTATRTPTSAPIICTTKPRAPLLTTPAPNAQLNITSVMLDWNDVACSKSYRVIVKRNPSNTTNAAVKGGLTVSQYTTNPLAPNTTYYWRVRSCNSNGCSYSGWRAFYINANAR